MADEPISNRRADDGLVRVIATRLNLLHEDVGDMRGVLKDLTSAITRLAVFEERQGQAALAQERAFKLLDKLEVRIAALEKTAPIQAQTSAWVGKLVWGTVAMVGLIVLKKLGLV